MALRVLLIGLLLASPALAHRLVIYAYAEAGEVVVETKFDSGRPAKEGTMILRDAAEAELSRHPLEEDGELRVPIPNEGTDGLIVEVITGGGHSDYWILTPADLGLE